MTEGLALELHSRGDTRRFGHAVASCVLPGDLLVLEGDLSCAFWRARSVFRATCP
jgi:hypothetical protein